MSDRGQTEARQRPERMLGVNSGGGLESMFRVGLGMVNR